MLNLATPEHWQSKNRPDIKRLLKSQDSIVNRICAHIPVMLLRPSLEKQNSPLIRRSSFYEQGHIEA